MRKWRNPRSPASDDWLVVHQVIRPLSFWPEVLRLVHEAPIAGQVDIRRTRSRIMAHFWWPRLYKDVAQFYHTCHVCQAVGKPQPAVKPAPSVPIPVFEEPCSKVLVGSLFQDQAKEERKKEVQHQVKEQEKEEKKKREEIQD